MGWPVEAKKNRPKSKKKTNAGSRGFFGAGWRYDGVYFGATPSVRTKRAEVRRISRFDARGMRLVYHNGHNLGHRSKHRAFRFAIDVWLAKDGRILVRFSYGISDVEWRSFEVRKLTVRPEEWNLSFDAEDGNEDFIPAEIRRRFDDWVEDVLFEYWSRGEV